MSPNQKKNLILLSRQAVCGESMSDKDLKLVRFNKMADEMEEYAVLMLDGNNYIEIRNKGAELLKGYTDSEIIGQNFKIFYT